MKDNNSSNSMLWDIFCTVSILGIWPRFIEPNLLKKSKLKMEIKALKKQLKIVQLSDLHFNCNIKTHFLNKVIRCINEEAPDLIVITGDFLCMGKLENQEGLRNFLLSLKAPLGVFAIFGNHDYNQGLNVNHEGYYDTVCDTVSILNGFKRLWKIPNVKGIPTTNAKNVHPSQDLLQILYETNVTILDNKTVQVDNILNLTGLGELMAGAVNPKKAFFTYDQSLPGIVLVHNPDAITQLFQFPGELVLSGHTHGGQVNLPWLWKRFTAMENAHFKSGLYKAQNKRLYISRGLGGVMPFRFNTFPEVVSILLKKGNS